MVLRLLRRQFHDLGQRMGGLKRGNDALQLAAELECVERFPVGGRDVFHAAGFLQPRMFRPDAGIIEARRNRMAFADLAVFVLQQIGAVAMQHAGLAARQRGAMAIGHVDAMAGGFNAVDFHRRIVEERMEQADGVGAAADARDQRIGQAPFSGLHLRAHFIADHALEIAHHRRIGMRASRRADAIERVGDIGDPIAQSLVHRVFQRARA